MKYRDNNSLAHFGIKGQHWGVRRFQEEDGTLTPAGKERYRGGDHRESIRPRNDSAPKRGPDAQKIKKTIDKVTKKEPREKTKAEQAMETASKIGDALKARPKGGPRMARGFAGNNQRVDNRTQEEMNADARFQFGKGALKPTGVVSMVVRGKKARKEVDASGVNAEKERIKDSDVKSHLARMNKKDRARVIDSMKKDPNANFKDSFAKVAKRRRRIDAAKVLATAAVVKVGPIVANKVANSPQFMQFMKNMRNRSMKNAVTLRSDEYRIGDRGLPAGRG